MMRYSNSYCYENNIIFDNQTRNYVKNGSHLFTNEQITRINYCSSITIFGLVDPLPQLGGNLKEIIFGSSSKFNQTLDFLPLNIEKITFAGDFDQSLDNLPPSMKEIIFDTNSRFNQPINCDVVPFNNFEKLPINFNSPIFNFPSHLTKIIFSDGYNQPLKNLPPNLQHITFGKNFNQPIENLPSTVDTILFPPDGKFSKLIDLGNTQINKIPDLPINFDAPILNIPKHWTKIIFSDGYNQPLTNFPAKLKHVTFGKKFNQPINNLPPTINTIIFSIKGDFNQQIDLLPDHLGKITLPNVFNQPINNLPPELRSLKLGSSFNHEIKNLPPKLKILKLGSSFNHEIKNLPSNLKVLRLETHDDCEIKNLPPKLRKLYLGFNNLYDIFCMSKLFNLPNSLRQITIINEDFTSSTEYMDRDLMRDTLYDYEQSLPQEFSDVTYAPYKYCHTYKKQNNTFVRKRQNNKITK
jgi:hypothetical protein